MVTKQQVCIYHMYRNIEPVDIYRRVKAITRRKGKPQRKKQISIDIYSCTRFS